MRVRTLFRLILQTLYGELFGKGKFTGKIEIDCFESGIANVNVKRSINKTNVKGFISKDLPDYGLDTINDVLNKTN